MSFSQTFNQAENHDRAKRRYPHRYVLKGDLAAFERLYGRYGWRLLGFVMALAASREGAEDIAQSAWMKLSDSLPKYRPRNLF